MSMQLELYKEGNSFLHRLDPRTKVLGVLVVFAISVIFTHPLFLGPFFLILLLIALLGGVPLSRLGIFLKSVALLVILSLIMWPLFYHPGEEIFRYGSIYVTDIGLLYGIGMAFRFVNMVLAPIILMLTTRQRDLILGMRGIGLPHKAAFALAVAFRFLPTIVGVGNGIIEAQRSRGLDVNQGGFRERTKNYGAIMGPLMISSLRMAQQLALAVEAKAMSSTARRTTIRPLRFGQLDKTVLASYAILLVTVIVLRILGYGAFDLT